ncbi:MAG: heavy-metal-associated domain-containing protein [Gemmataceae bacterium]
MKKWIGTMVAVALAVCTLQHLQAQAQAPQPTYSVISVEKMHCESCARRISGKLYEVAGVEKIQVDVEKKLIWVHPKTGAQPSPRALWEAVERGADRPTKLHSPYGVFASKPQQ